MNNLVKSFSFISLLSSAVYAECIVDYSVMYTIAKNERHAKRNVGYPYLISFNNELEAQAVRKKLSLNWIDNRTVDCNNVKQCQRNIKEVNKLKITNVDLGAFQINQKSFNYQNTEEYFNLGKSYQNACKIVYSHYLETGKWSWETIARYHSKTQKYNKMYSTNLEKNYRNIVEKQQNQKEEI